MKEERSSEIKNNGKPYYDKKSKSWKVDISGYGTEKGNLTEIVYSFLRTSMYYPYESGQRIYPDIEPHVHDFEGILSTIINNPESFSIGEDQQQYYSKQELTLAYQLRDALISINAETLRQE